MNNYSAWDTDPGAFDRLNTIEEKIAFLIKFAVLAPSNHNSQPWLFELSGDTLVMKPDLSRALPGIDPVGRQMYISLGCCLENIMIAAHYYDMRFSTCEFIRGEDDYSVKMVFIEEKRRPCMTCKKESLIRFIPQRVSDKGRYLPKLPEKKFSILSKMFSSAHGFLRCDLVTDFNIKSQITEVVISAMSDAMNSHEFRRELLGCIKPNRTIEMTGMPRSTLGLPLLASYLYPSMNRMFNSYKLIQRREENLLQKHTPAFMIVSSGDSKPGWISSGKLYQCMALVADRMGMSTSIISAPIEVGQYHREFKNILEIKGLLRPQIFARVGYSINKRRFSPRIPSEMVIRRV